MKKSFFQVKTIRRYLFSYVMLFFLPLIILNAVFHFHYQKSLQDELIHNHQILLEKLQLSTEYELSKLQLISDQLTLNGFSSDIPSSAPIKGMNLIRFLSTQRNVNPFFSDIVIYYQKSGLFYSSTSSYTHKYFRLLYQDQPKAFEDLTNFFDSPGALYTAPPSIILPTSGDKQANLALVYPVSSNGLDTSALLFAFFPSAKLENLCAQYYDPASTTVLLANQEGELLSVYGNASSLVTETYRQSVHGSAPSPGHIIREIEGRKYLINCAQSDSLGWAYLTCTEIDSALSPSIVFRNQQFLFTLLIILAGGFLILLSMYFNFLPLYHLIDLASDLSIPLPKVFKNELDHIGGLLSQLATENTHLNRQLEDSQLAAKEYIISQLITGHALKREYLERSLIQTILSPQYDNYAVFTVHFSDFSPVLEDTRAGLIEEIEAFSNEKMIFLCKEDHAFNTFVCIILMNHHSAPQLSSILNAIKSSLSSFVNGNLCFGVGNTYNQMESLSQSYIEASTALDYRFIKGNNALVFFSSVEGNIEMSASAYPHALLQQLSLALSSGNTKALEESLDGIFSCISGESANLFQAKSICYDMIRMIAKALPDMQSDIEEDSVLPNIFQVSHFGTVEDILSTLRQVGYAICKRINSSYDENNQILVENIKTFIRDKGFNSDFSQEMLANHFHMAVPNLSSFYKEHTGENINDTLTRLRMDKALFLLSTTTLPINQIALNIGYDNVSSFIRRFKQIYQMPPGAWRESHSGK